MGPMLDTVIDVFRVRQYFNVITRAREFVEGVREDAGLIDDARRALVTFPLEHRRQPDLHPFPPVQPLRIADLQGRRLALVATGGSGALASLVGAARALEEAGVRPSVISLCSGSSLFGFPIAAGIPAEEVAAFTLGIRPEEYVDIDWRMLASVLPRAAKGFGGVIRGERIETLYRRLLGDITLGEMPIPAYAPIWNIEENRLEYIGPRTHPDLPVARAIHMAIALPLFIEPVELAGEPRRVEAVDGQRHLGWLPEVENRPHREDVDDAAVAPVAAGELHRLDEQRQRDGHVDGPGHRQVRVGAGAHVLEAILLDVPDRRVGGDRHLAEGHVAQQPAVQGLDALAPDDTAEALGRPRKHRAHHPPVDVHELRGAGPGGEGRDLVGGDAGGDGEPEQG